MLPFARGQSNRGRGNDSYDSRRGAFQNLASVPSNSDPRQNQNDDRNAVLRKRSAAAASYQQSGHQPKGQRFGDSGGACGGNLRSDSGAQQSTPPMVVPVLPKVLTEKVDKDPNIKHQHAVRLVTTEQKKATRSNAPLLTFLLQHDRCPARPDIGTSGRQFKLLSNHFRIKLPSGTGHRYELTLKIKSAGKPNAEANAATNKYNMAPKAVTRIAVQYWLRLIGEDPHNFAFDGKCNLYARNAIAVVLRGELNTFEYEVPAAFMPGTEARTDGVASQFELQVLYSAVIPFDELNIALNGKSPGSLEYLRKVMNVCNVVLNQQCFDYGYPNVRNTVFPPSVQAEIPIMLGNALELKKGLYQSVCPSTRKTVNIDMSYSTFLPACSLLNILVVAHKSFQALLACFATRAASDDQLQFMNKVLCKRLRHARIEMSFNGISREYTFDKLIREGAANKQFEMHTNGVSQVTTVLEYFKTQKNFTLKYPYMPLVKALGRNTYLPLELCYVVANQHYFSELEPDEQDLMLKNSCVKPNDRSSTINNYDFVNVAGIARSPYLERFGMEVNLNMEETPGRVLPSPLLHFGPLDEERRAGVKEAIAVGPSWNMLNRKILHSGTIKKWLFLQIFVHGAMNPFEYRYHYDEIIKNLCRLAVDSLGMAMRPHIRSSVIYSNAIVESIRQLAKSDFDLLVIFLPQVCEDAVYAEVKQAAELQEFECGIMTQCIGSKTLTARNDISESEHLVNIAMQINQKMGGVNWCVPLIRDIMAFGRPEPFAIMGADVNHPQPDVHKYPSLAAMTISMDDFAMRYSATFSVQRHCKETIEKLSDMVQSLLINYYKSNAQRKPKRIVFYRNGLREMNYSKCAKELTKIRDGCTKMQAGGYSPSITYVCVQKRHHTRFFAMNQGDLNRPAIVPAGTTVDQGITHVYDFDFFLMSHSGGVGTSRPTYYHVYCDDNKFTSNSLQHLTYNLCFCCACSDKSISYPAPCHYAHLMADRARDYLKHRVQDLLVEDNASNAAAAHVVKSKAEIRDEAKQYANLPKFQNMRIHEKLRQQMFFI